MLQARIFVCPPRTIARVQVCQTYPKKTPAYLMKRFFDFFVGWPWEKTPVRLCLQVGPPCFLGGIV